MTKRIAHATFALLLAGGAALADFSYEQTSKITGGAMMSMVKIMGAFSKQLREPMRSTFAVKAGRMAMITPQMTQVIDLDKETITEINYEKKRYSVTSFADWSAALSDADSKIKAGDEGEYQDITITAKVQQPGDTKTVNGMATKHAIVTLVFEGTDKKGNKAAFMTMVVDMWLSPDVKGYAEMRDFYARMAQKLNWSPTSGIVSAMAPGSSKGMAEIMKEMSKLDGMPVLQYTSMVFGDPAQAAKIAEASRKQQENPQPEQKAEQHTSTASKLGKLGGRLGGFGGFGRKRQEEPESEPAAQGGEPAGTGSFMDMTTETSNYSQAAVDASKFEVPAGFKQVESETLKQMKRR